MTTAIAVAALLLALGAVGFCALVWSKVNADWPTEEHEKPIMSHHEDLIAPPKERRKPVVLFKPPMLDGMTMRDWLRYHWRSVTLNEGDVWVRVVDHFYDRAADHPLVAPYFVDKNVGEIKKKFLATLLIVTHSGVTDVAAERLIEVHRGLGITGRAYDATVNALTDTLKEYGIPESATAQMIPMLKALRDGMVTVN